MNTYKWRQSSVARCEITGAAAVSAALSVPDQVAAREDAEELKSNKGFANTNRST